MHVLYIYMPRVYVAFILDMIIIFNKIINNSRPPAWYFSLTRTGNKEFTIVGLIFGIHMNIERYQQSRYVIFAMNFYKEKLKACTIHPYVGPCKPYNHTQVVVHLTPQ